MSASLPSQMIAIPLPAHGGPDVLVARPHPLPEPGPADVLIRVAAAGINAPDLAQRRGHYDPPPGASPLPGLEVSGEIVAIGPEAAGFALGDRVVALCNGGGYAEYVAVPHGQVLPLPSGWSLVEGAALPETFFTVQQTLVMRAGLAPGMVVLVHGAAGGIGGAAIQLANLHGARVIAVVSTPEKAAYARELGAWQVIDHTREDLVSRTMALTGERGADRILALSGGDMLMANVKASARFGHIVQVSGIDGARSEINLGLLLARQLTLSGSTLRPQTSAVKAAIAQGLRASAWPAMEDGRIRPPAIRTFALDEAPEAHRAMEERANFGKIVLLTAHGAALMNDKSIAGR